MHSYNSYPNSWLGIDGYEGLNVETVLDSLINNEIINPLIIVMPDAHTKFGGSRYTNSPAEGNWLNCISVDLVNYIDKKYRTVKKKEARGIADRSGDAYGALYVAISRPDVFSAVLGMSAPNLVNPDPFMCSDFGIVISD